jgi:lipoprotein-releasing system permease protein
VANGAAPFGKHERMLAMRYLRAKQKEGGIALISIISVVAIALAVFGLITVMAVMNGFREKLVSQIVGMNGHVYVDVSTKTAPEVLTLARRARATPNVVHVAPLIEGQVLATLNGRAVGALARGVSKRDLETLPIISKNIAAGSLANFGVNEYGEGNIIVGYRLALNLGASVDGPLTLISPEGAATPFGVTPRRKTYFIGGLFKINVADYDSAIIYMPIEEARLFFSKAAADRLEIRIKDPDKSEEVMRALRANLGPDVYISDWKGQNEGLMTSRSCARLASRVAASRVSSRWRAERLAWSERSAA